MKKIIDIEHKLYKSNLPNLENGKEERFVEKFCKIYKEKYGKLHANCSKQNIYFLREFQVAGYGVPDVITVAGNEGISQTITRAYEAKIYNWRKALSQAYRYKFFANMSIVIMPLDKISPPLKYINSFELLKVGLWGVDTYKNEIKKIFTPKYTKPIKQNYNFFDEYLKKLVF